MPRYNGGFIGTDGLDAPDAPVGVTATAGNAQASVAFTDAGGGTSDTTSFVVQVSTNGTDYSGGSATGSSSPIDVTSLTNGTDYTAKVWAINAYGTSAPSGASSSFTPALPIRAIFAGGTKQAADAQVNIIDYLDMDSTGNASDFGDLSSARDMASSAMASSTRVVFSGGGRVDNGVNTIEYVTAASTGDVTDFGDSTVWSAYPSGLSSSTRGISAGGYNYSSGGQGTNANTNVIEYITIANTGNATDFGDQTAAHRQGAGYASTTRGIMCGGRTGSDSNVIQYITIASTGNATDFGDLTNNSLSPMQGASNATRGLQGMEYDSSATPVTTYITIASTGNSQTFGDLSARRDSGSACADSTNCLFVGGNQSGSGRVNTIDYYTIASTGNASDWGDLTQGRTSSSSTTTGHGGIS